MDGKLTISSHLIAELKRGAAAKRITLREFAESMLHLALSNTLPPGLPPIVTSDKTLPAERVVTVPVQPPHVFEPPTGPGWPLPAGPGLPDPRFVVTCENGGPVSVQRDPAFIVTGASPSVANRPAERVFSSPPPLGIPVAREVTSTNIDDLADAELTEVEARPGFHPVRREAPEPEQLPRPVSSPVLQPRPLPQRQPTKGGAWEPPRY